MPCLQAALICVSLLCIQGSRGQIVLTQTPEAIAVPVGEPVTIRCKTSEDAYSYVGWYQQKPGQPPKLLITGVSQRQPGVSERFSGSGSGTDFTFRISRTETDDAAVYSCQQRQKLPLTFGQGTKLEIKRDDVAPSVFIFPPSPEQLSSGMATVLCMINTYYPGDAKVTWKADDNIITKDVETSENMPDANSTYSRSSMITFSKAEWESHQNYICEVTQKALTSPLQKSVNRLECA